jgi:hypothetical protein
MFRKFGYEVKRLVRVQIGGLSLVNLPVGSHRVLTQAEVARYFPEGAKPKSDKGARKKPNPISKLTKLPREKKEGEGK